MTITRLLSFSAILFLGAGNVMAQEETWTSYRDAYKLMIRFEKYGKPKHLIQSHYQVVPRNGNLSLDGVRLTLTWSSTQLELPLDAAGRAVFPLLKSAYDDNARLLLNRAPNLYMLQPQISIAPRADGVYETANLRAACEQILQYWRYVGKASMQDKQCVGVRFSYAINGRDAVVKFRSGEHAPTSLPVEEGSAFADDSGATYKTLTYRFSDWPEKGQIVTQSAPVAIAAVFK